MSPLRPRPPFIPPVMSDRFAATPPSTPSPRIGIVEDQVLVLSLLADLCRHRFGWNVVLTAKSAAETLAGLEAAQPDALLVDINLPDDDGITLALGIKKRFPHLRIIVLSAECTEYTIFRVRQSGLDGYVDKNSDPDFIQDALQTVIRDGGTYFSPLMKEVARSTALDSQAFLKILSGREHELLPLFGMGKPDTEIAQSKGLSPDTIRKHRENIMRKLGHRSVSELVHYCIEKGFVQTRPDGDVRPTPLSPRP